MRYPIKLNIMKAFDVGVNWKRFRIIDKIIIDNNSPIKTEAQLAYYIYRGYGEGRYMALAWQKGVEGFWCFWLGYLRENGFVRDLGKNKEIDNLKNEMRSKEIDYDERQMIEEEIDMTRRLNAEVKKTRRGPVGLIKFRPGQMHNYQEY